VPQDASAFPIDPADDPLAWQPETWDAEGAAGALISPSRLTPGKSEFLADDSLVITESDAIAPEWTVSAFEEGADQVASWEGLLPPLASEETELAAAPVLPGGDCLDELLLREPVFTDAQPAASLLPWWEERVQPWEALEL